MSKKITTIKNICPECDGFGNISSCCNDYIDNNKCLACGKFCHKETCHNCNGEGELIYNIGDNVEIFVCVWSDEYLKKQLYIPKKHGDNKTFIGKIIEFPDIYNAIIKINKKKIIVNIDDISIC